MSRYDKLRHRVERGREAQEAMDAVRATASWLQPDEWEHLRGLVNSGRRAARELEAFDAR